MDNNSNTLFGFEAITDVLSAEHSTEGTNLDIIDNANDDLTDEEIERLQKESAKYKKSVSDVFGTKQTKTTDDDDLEDDDDDVEDDDDDTNLIDVKKKSSKSKKNTKDDDIDPTADNNDDNDDIDVDDVDEDESSKVTALFDAIAEELEWEFDDDEEKPSTVEDLVSYFRDAIKENSVPQYASEDVQKLDEFVRNGGKLEDFYSITPDLDLENFDTTDENNQKLIVRELLREKGFNDKQISRKIEKYEDAGILEDEAEDAVEAMKEITESKKEQLLSEQKRQNEEKVQRQQKFVDDVVGSIKSLDNIRGIKIPSKDKKELLTYIFKADANGLTQYQKDYSKSVKNLIESAYFTMKGDILLDTAKKMGTSSAMKTLKQSLKSTGAGKGTKRINTSSSNNIWSRAVQSLI